MKQTCDNCKKSKDPQPIARVRWACEVHKKKFCYDCGKQHKWNCISITEFLSDNKENI